MKYLDSNFSGVGDDVIIGDPVDIRRPHLVKIGNHVAIDPFTTITTQLELGNYIHISPKVSIIGGKTAKLTMEDYTFISTGCNVICAGEKFYGDGLVCPFLPEKYRDTVIDDPIVIKRFGGICAGSTVLSGSVISEGTVIGAGSLVLKNTVTKPWTIYAGCPIREIRPRNKETILRYADEILKNENRS
jgi:acetyltransferase-like isoleucine patch superfamily enzyme